MLDTFQQQQLYESALSTLASMEAAWKEAMDAIKAAAWQHEEVGRTLNRHTDGQVHA